MPITDPVEKVVADALDFHHVLYTHKSTKPDQKFDFHLPRYDLLIECRRASTDGLDGQARGYDNLLIIRGLPAARAFALLLLDVV